MRLALCPLGQLQPLMQLLLKLAIAHLLEDVGIPRLVDLEGFAAVGADDFVHGDGTFLVGWIGICFSIPANFGGALKGAGLEGRCEDRVDTGLSDK